MTATIAFLEGKAKELRRKIVREASWGKKAHLGGSCSAADVIAALYFGKMRIDPKHPDAPDRDRFLLSKGHAALVQYAALAELGFFPEAELDKVKTLGGILQGHPDRKLCPGVEANTGSLGQGISIACGIAAGLKLSKSPARVYVLVGDGEQSEGQVWEAAMAAKAFKLDNLVAILDRNNLQATGPITERFDTNPHPEKWAAFGWRVIEIDGHDMRQIVDALDAADKTVGQPTVVIANTVKGKGISFAENNPAFHNGMFTKEQYEQALAELAA